MKIFRFFIFIVSVNFYAQVLANEVSFKTTDNAQIYADFQFRGSHAFLLAHGAIFNKESWGEFEQRLLKKNYTVLAIDFRGYGKSTSGDNPRALYQDILAGVKFLRSQQSITQVAVLGASMGGAAAAKASVNSDPDAIDQLILLSPAQVYKPEKIKGNLLMIASKDEYLAKAIIALFDKAPEPKLLKLIEGNAHAQHIFKTPQAEELTRIIIQFLESSKSQ